jgi:hypothetical protein
MATKAKKETLAELGRKVRKANRELEGPLDLLERMVRPARSGPAALLDLEERTARLELKARLAYLEYKALGETLDQLLLVLKAHKVLPDPSEPLVKTGRDYRTRTSSVRRPT